MPGVPLPSIAAVVDWTRPGRSACQEQTVATLAALSRLGHPVELHMPQGRADPAMDAAALCAHFAVRGSFEVVQHRSRWGGSLVWNTALWLRQIFASGALGRSDVIYSRLPVLLWSGWACPQPFLLDHYRPWPQVVPPLRPLIRRTLAARHCLGIALHSAYAAEAYAGLAEDPDRLLVAMNGHEQGRYATPVDRATARNRLGLPLGRPLIVYTGRTNERKGLDRLLEVADLRPDSLFAIVGHEGQDWIAREAGRRDNVMLVGWQEPAALPDWLHAADILAIPPSLTPLETFGTCVLPLKTFQYLAAGRPILAPRSPDTAGLLEHGANAWLVTPDRPEEAAEAVARLLADRNLAEALSAGAHRTSAGLSWDARAAKLSGFVERRLAAVRGASVAAASRVGHAGGAAPLPAVPD